jgi:Effector Associated Constant Component 1
VAAYGNVPNTHSAAEEAPVEAEIQISQVDDVTEFAALRKWLHDERALTGLVRAVRRQPGETELGAAFDLLTVALGSSGVGVLWLDASPRRAAPKGHETFILRAAST